MARSDLFQVATYVEEDMLERLRELAKLEGSSVSKVSKELMMMSIDTREEWVRSLNAPTLKTNK